MIKMCFSKHVIFLTVAMWLCRENSLYRRDLKTQNNTWVKRVILKFGPHIILSNKDCMPTFNKIKQAIKHIKLQILLKLIIILYCIIILAHVAHHHPQTENILTSSGP
jgi:hypothetical protein